MSAALSLRDGVALVKPRITLMVAITAAGGMFLAPGDVSWPTRLAALLGIVLSVGGANVLNMYLERDTDRFMTRTAQRPLPAGRMRPVIALAFGLALSILSVPVLLAGVNPLTCALSTVALVTYVLVYTPMKRRSWTALLVGAVPGAIPPLLGWTAVTGRLDAGGVLLFGMLFVWQVPHFMAIALFRAREYAAAGIRVYPVERGADATRWQIVAWSGALAVVTLAAAYEHLGGHADSRAWLGVAAALNAAFFALSAWGLFARDRDRWARSLFALSLVYLTAMFAVLVGARMLQ